MEEEHDGVSGEDSEAVTDVGNDDQGHTHACKGDKDKQPGDRIKQTRRKQCFVELNFNKILQD